MIKINDLFNSNNAHINEFFANYTYPWEVLPNIKSLIEKFDKSNLKEISHNVFIGENVSIAKTATIVGPAIILSNVTIRPGTYIRENVFICEGCTVGNSTELKNAILLENAVAPHFNYVGDSILGVHAHLGAGAICSNLKQDGANVVIHSDKEHETGLRKVGAFIGDNAEIGCNSVLNPGTIIGKNTNVYPLNSLRGVFGNNLIIKSQTCVINKK